MLCLHLTVLRKAQGTLQKTCAAAHKAWRLCTCSDQLPSWSWTHKGIICSGELEDPKLQSLLKELLGGNAHEGQTPLLGADGSSLPGIFLPFQPKDPVPHCQPGMIPCCLCSGVNEVLGTGEYLVQINSLVILPWAPSEPCCPGGHNCEPEEALGPLHLRQLLSL